MPEPLVWPALEPGTLEHEGAYFAGTFHGHLGVSQEYEADLLPEAIRWELKRCSQSVTLLIENPIR